MSCRSCNSFKYFSNFDNCFSLSSTSSFLSAPQFQCWAVLSSATTLWRDLRDGPFSKALSTWHVKPSRLQFCLEITWVLLGFVWKCWVNIPNYSHLIGIMIINHWVFDGYTTFSDKPTWVLLGYHWAFHGPESLGKLKQVRIQDFFLAADKILKPNSGTCVCFPPNRLITQHPPILPILPMLISFQTSETSWSFP